MWYQSCTGWRMRGGKPQHKYHIKYAESHDGINWQRNGLVAIELLNTTHRLPDVVLLDIEMPVKDGIQTLREIRKSVRYSHLPVIMVTSRTGAKHRALAEAAGCNGYMGKPFNFPKLIEQIATLTQHKFQLS